MPAEPLIIFEDLLISSLISSLGLLSFSQDGLFQFCEERSSSLLGLSTCHFFLSATPFPYFPPYAHSVTKIKNWHTQNILILPFYSYHLSQLVFIYSYNFLYTCKRGPCIFCSLPYLWYLAVSAP